MPKSSRGTFGYTIWTLVPPASLIAALGLAYSTPGAMLAGLLSIPWLAWRYDNDSGAFFVLALLLLLILLVLALLLILMAVVLSG